VNNDFVLITGSSNIDLANKVGNLFNKKVYNVISRFADGEIRVIIPENIRKKEVFIIQSTCPPVDSNLMELLLMMDAAKRASAKEISVIIPYFGYSRQDRKEQPRVPVSAALVADLIEHSGASRIVTVDIHSEQEQGFVKIPWDNLYASYSLIPELKKNFGKNLIIASPDKGGVLRATAYAQLLNADGVAIVYKERDVKTTNISASLDLIGDVKGKEVLLVDDIVDTAGTLIGAVELLDKKGAENISAAVTHGLFSSPAMEKIKKSKLKRVFVTDTIPQKNYERKEIISVATLLSEAIKCIHSGQSISKKLYK